MVLESLNNVKKINPNVPYPDSDPLLYSILSNVDCRPSHWNKHSMNKINDIPPRPNKTGMFG